MTSSPPSPPFTKPFIISKNLIISADVLCKIYERVENEEDWQTIITDELGDIIPDSESSLDEAMMVLGHVEERLEFDAVFDLYLSLRKVLQTMNKNFIEPVILKGNDPCDICGKPVKGDTMDVVSGKPRHVNCIPF